MAFCNRESAVKYAYKNKDKGADIAHKQRCSAVKTKSYAKILLNQLLMLILDIGIRTIIVLVVVVIILVSIMQGIIKAVGVIVSSLSKS